MAAKIRKNDEVIVLAGRDKGKRGQVKLIKANKIFVDGISLVKKHSKATQESEGKIIEKEMALDISSVAIFNPSTNKADRVCFKFNEAGKKERFFKSNDQLID